MVADQLARRCCNKEERGGREDKDRRARADGRAMDTGGGEKMGEERE